MDTRGYWNSRTQAKRQTILSRHIQRWIMLNWSRFLYTMKSLFIRQSSKIFQFWLAFDTPFRLYAPFTLVENFKCMTSGDDAFHNEKCVWCCTFNIFPIQSKLIIDVRFVYSPRNDGIFSSIKTTNILVEIYREKTNTLTNSNDFIFNSKKTRAYATT